MQAQARCLVRAGKQNEAIAILTGPLGDERYRHATDSQGRLLVPNAELLALELLKDSAPDRAPLPLFRLRRRVLDYSDPDLSSPQRRFLMRELQRLFPDPAVAQMLAAEDLAARCLEAGPPRSRDPALRPSALPGVWQFASTHGRVLALHQSDALQSRMRAGIPPQLLPADVSVAFLPPGKEVERSFLSLPAGRTRRTGGWPSR